MNDAMRAPSTPSGVLRMAAPLVVSFWMRAAVTLVDTVYAALVGDAAVASIGLTIPLEFLMIAVWVGLSTGLTSGLARAMGAREGGMIDQYRKTCWRLVWIVSPMFTLVGLAIWLFADRLGFEPAVGRSLQIYGTVLIGGSAFTTFWSIIPDSLVKAHHDTRSTMWAGIWTNVLNVGLNTLFLFGFEWGVFGIALSTVLARIGGLTYALARSRHHEKRRRDSGATPGTALDSAPYRTILSLAIPSSVTFTLMALEAAVANALLARGSEPTAAIAAYSIYYRVVLFCLQPVIATAVAMLPYAARCAGAEDFSGVRRGLRQSGWAAAIYSIFVVGPGTWLLAPWLATRLAESPLTAEYAAFALRTVPWACLAGAPFLLCRPVFEALNRGRPGLVVALVRYIGLTPPMAWGGMLVAQRLGWPSVHGLIVGLVLAGGISSTALYTWLVRTLPRSGPAPVR